VTLDSLDARTAAAAAVRSLISALSTDLGGEDRLSAGEKELVQRVAMTGAMAADFEAHWVAGQPIEASEFTSYLQTVNVQRRVLATLGLQRTPRDVTPSLSEYLAQLQAEDEAKARAAAEAVEEQS
jgi:hypothetical protein